jgi:hypothetical protein
MYVNAGTSSTDINGVPQHAMNNAATNSSMRPADLYNMSAAASGASHGLQKKKIYDQQTSITYRSMVNKHSGVGSGGYGAGLPNVVTGMSPPSRPLSREELYGMIASSYNAHHQNLNDKDRSAGDLSKHFLCVSPKKITADKVARNSYLADEDSENEEAYNGNRSILPSERYASQLKSNRKQKSSIKHILSKIDRSAVFYTTVGPC